MAEDKSGVGGFRTQLGGFHKEDVIAYIQSLKEEHSRELEELRAREERRCAAYEKALEDANSALREQYERLQTGEADHESLQTQLAEQLAANRELQAQVDDLTLDAADREELARLRQINTDMEAELEQLAARYRLLEQGAQLSAKDRDDLAARLQQITQERDDLLLRLSQAEEEDKMHLRQAEEELRRQREQLERSARGQLEQAEEELRGQREQTETVRAENDRYRQLLNGAGGFVADLRGMGRRYLDDASSRCDSRLAALAEAVDSLKDQLTAAAADLADARDALREQSSRDTEHMDALGDEMSRTAAGLEPPDPVCEDPEPEQTAPPVETVKEDETEPIKADPLPEEPAPEDRTAPADFF